MTYLIGSTLMIGSLVASLTAAFAGATGGTFGVVMLAAVIGWNMLSANTDTAPGREGARRYARAAAAMQPRFTVETEPQAARAAPVAAPVSNRAAGTFRPERH